MNLQKLILIIALLFCAIIVWIGRYDMVAAPSSKGYASNAYLLDRWTGKVLFFHDMSYAKTSPVGK